MVCCNLESIRVNEFSARNNEALAKNDIKNTEYIVETAKIQLKQLILKAYFDIGSYRKYNTLLQQVSDFSESFKEAEVRFNASASNQIDYLIAKYDYAFQTKIVDYYKGKLV